MIESDKAPKGLSEDTVRFISAKKNEPEWMLALAARRLSPLAHHARAEMGARSNYGPIDYQDIYYYSAPKKKAGRSRSTRSIRKFCATYEKLGIPLREREALLGIQKPAYEAGEEGERGEGGNGYGRVAVDAVFDSVSVATTFKAELGKAGVMFLPISEAMNEHPDLVRKYLGSVVPITDNFFAMLNSAVFGRFIRLCAAGCPLPDGAVDRSPINERNTGQFERTLIIADRGAYVSYLEGCTAPKRDENGKPHAAVVELIALDDAEVKYSTGAELVFWRCRKAAAASTTS